jgi:hypothetical protein
MSETPRSAEGIALREGFASSPRGRPPRAFVNAGASAIGPPFILRWPSTALRP